MELRNHVVALALLAAGCATTQEKDEPPPASPPAPVQARQPAMPEAALPASLPTALYRRGTAAVGQVEIELYIMSRCPFAARMLRGIADALNELGPGAVELSVDYIVSDRGGQLSALHGPDEIAGNKLQLCAIRHHGMERALRFIACQADDFRSIPGNWKRCAHEASLAPDAIEQCLASGEGEILLRTSMRRSIARNAKGSPTILVAGQRHTGGRTKQDFIRAVCDRSGPSRSVACAQLPEEVAVDLLVLSDRRCKTCRTAQMIKNLRSRFFSELRVRVVDYQTAEGKQLYRQLKLVNLPAYLFTADVEQHPRYSSISRWVTNVGGYKKMRMPARFSPTDEICDNGIDDTGNGKVDCADPTCSAKLLCRPSRPRQLDLFIMSQCPYGNKALLALREVLQRFRGKIALNVHYIADRQPDGGFRALHGQSEVEENMRQLCARHHYGRNDRYLEYLWCRAPDYRGTDWRACARGGIRARVLQRCASGPQGRRLLARDIKLAQQLGVSGSPTWLANNRHKFSGITAEVIRSKVCQHNPGLDGC